MPIRHNNGYEHHERSRTTPTMSLSWQHSWLQFLSVKKQMFLFATFESWPEIIAKITNGSHIVLTLPITLVGVNDPCLGILVVIKTEPAA